MLYNTDKHVVLIKILVSDVLLDTLCKEVLVFIKWTFGDVCKRDMLLEPSCCKKRQKKSRARNWFGE